MLELFLVMTKEVGVRKFLSFFAVALVAGLSGCQTIPKAKDYAEIKLSFVWPKNASCFGHSPEIQLENVPKGTASLEFKLKDFNASFNHGGGVVAYNGQKTIPEAALKNYSGPCPPVGNVHTYEISVVAYSEGKALALGQGAATRKFPE